MEPHSDAPAAPYQGYLAELGERLERELAETEPLASAHAGAPEAVHAALTKSVEARADALVALSHDIHAHPELLFEERYAAAALARVVETAGHEAQVGCYGLDTAVIAEAGSGRPRVAVLAEYDALPGIGHACGHNVIAATAAGAFLAVAEVVADLEGSVVLLGTPAEEGGGGKEHMARAGAFDDVDAAVMLHPFGADAAEHEWLGVRTVDVTYHGLSAHAAAMPHLGRNALDAAVSAYQGMALLRQHMLPGDRIHGIITDGGQKPNIVPDRAALAFFLRSKSVAGMLELSERAEAIFSAAAQATGTRAELGWDPCPLYLPVRNNTTLVARYAEALGTRGRRVMPLGVVPAEMTGSTDLGNVSMRLPAIHPLLAIAPPTVAIHNPEFARWAASERADQGVVDGAVGLAMTMVDYLTDEALRADVDAEFTAAGGPVDVERLLE